MAAPRPHPLDPSTAAEPVEHVVLVSDDGHPIGAQPKAVTHHADTPLHLGFSCYVVDDAGRFLLTRRAHDKATFPGVWTNSFCGHPAPGEPLPYAVRRRANDELGVRLGWVRLVLPAFRYRAHQDGIVEHELCPVVVAGLADGARIEPDLSEIDGLEWVDWADFADAVTAGSRTVSPWCTEQVAWLRELGPDPARWAEADAELLPPALRPPHTRSA